jgi:hypothetical protein
MPWVTSGKAIAFNFKHLDLENICMRDEDIHVYAYSVLFNIAKDHYTVLMDVTIS